MIRFHVDATEAASQWLTCQMVIPDAPAHLRLNWPRWTPGSYLIREPLKYVTDLAASDVNGALKVRREGANAHIIRGAKGTVTITWRALAAELTVRTNHMDAHHLHLVPAATWPLPADTPADAAFEVDFTLPGGWRAHSQMDRVEGDRFSVTGVDELYDGIVQCCADPVHTLAVDGLSFHFLFHDMGGLTPAASDVARFLDAAKLVLEEHHATFGVPTWDDYLTVIHLTGGARGGLEHLRSQSSMVPRTAMMPGDEDGWRDLVSLFSHEYLHVWNVKRLRPAAFVEYDLSAESHTDMLWWFEGVTSWLGDILCWRSGAWSEADWHTDLARKLKRHWAGHGNAHQSLAESSHEAWIHLYRPHAHSRDMTISYYLEGEMAAICLDAEIRRRTRGEVGLDDVCVHLWKQHGLDSPEGAPGGLGIDMAAVVAACNEVSGGRLGGVLHRLMEARGRPDLATAFGHLGKKFATSTETAWLGITLRPDGTVARVDPTGPAHGVLNPGDELLFLDGIRIKSDADVKKLIRGREGETIDVLASHRGAQSALQVTLAPMPSRPTKIEGRGNALWRSLGESRRTQTS